MKAELILPIESLRGVLRQKDGLYFRMYMGKQIVQRCPNRKGYVPTEKEKAGQDLFAARTRIVNQKIKEGSKFDRKELWRRLMKNEPLE